MKGIIRILVSLLLICFMLRLFVKPNEVTPAVTTTTTIPVVSAVMIEQTLESVARDKLKDLVTTGYWSHTNSDGCDFRCRTVGLHYQWAGENLYKGDCSYYEAFKSWEESPGHKEVLEAPFTDEVLLKEHYEGGCYIILLKAIR